MKKDSDPARHNDLTPSSTARFVSPRVAGVSLFHIIMAQQQQRDGETGSPPVLVSADSPDVSYEDASDDPLLLSSPEKDTKVSGSSSCCGSGGDNSLIGNVGSNMKTKILQFLAYYVRFTSSALNQDKLLKLLQWSLWIWGNSVNVNGSGNSNKELLKKWLLKLYNEVSMARYATRLLGFPTALEAAVNDSWTSSSVAVTASSGSKMTTNGTGNRQQSVINAVYKIVGKVLAYSMVGYHPTELMAYVLWMKPPMPSPSYLEQASVQRQRQLDQCPGNGPRSAFWKSILAFPASSWSAEKWSYISCRFWLAYVVAELLQCAVQWHELRSVQQQLQNDKDGENDTTTEETQAQVAQVQGQIRNTVLQGLRDALFVVPCIQWSLPHWDTKPWLRPSTINTLMWCESLVCLYQALRNNK
jgi:hypothetical protein